MGCFINRTNIIVRSAMGKLNYFLQPVSGSHLRNSFRLRPFQSEHGPAYSLPLYTEMRLPGVAVSRRQPMRPVHAVRPTGLAFVHGQRWRRSI